MYPVVRITLRTAVLCCALAAVVRSRDGRIPTRQLPSRVGAGHPVEMSHTRDTAAYLSGSSTHTSCDEYAVACTDRNMHACMLSGVDETPGRGDARYIRSRAA